MLRPNKKTSEQRDIRPQNAASRERAMADFKARTNAVQ
jgi:hypothetical protein